MPKDDWSRTPVGLFVAGRRCKALVDSYVAARWSEPGFFSVCQQLFNLETFISHGPSCDDLLPFTRVTNTDAPKGTRKAGRGNLRGTLRPLHFLKERGTSPANIRDIIIRKESGILVDDTIHTRFCCVVPCRSAVPLIQMLEGGTWKAGRYMAKMLRPQTCGPPIQIVSDGTVF